MSLKIQIEEKFSSALGANPIPGREKITICKDSRLACATGISRTQTLQKEEPVSRAKSALSRIYSLNNLIKRLINFYKSFNPFLKL